MIPVRDQLRALLADHDPRRELRGIARPQGGLVNQVFLLATTRRDYVLKVFDDATGMWKPQEEHAVFDHMRSIGVPVPRVERIDIFRRAAPFIYSLVE